MRAAATLVEAHARRRAATARLATARTAETVIARQTRKVFATRRFLTLRFAALTVQTLARMIRSRCKYRDARSAATVILSRWRCYTVLTTTMLKDDEPHRDVHAIVSDQASGNPFDKLKGIVLAAAERADDVCGRKLIMNPHLWNREDMSGIFDGNTDPRQTPLSSSWPALTAFMAMHPSLSAGDVRLGYHGTKNGNRVSKILFEGLRPEWRRGRFCYFGVSAEACRQYGLDIAVFLIPKSACGTVRGDGAFDAQECDALPVAAYCRPSGYLFCNLLNDRLPHGSRRF
jgi:hypothetical protein